MARTASGILGVGLLPYFLPGKSSAAPFEGASKAKQFATAKNVIYLYMSGGMSHLDTFDPKEAGTPVMGPVKPIATSANSVRISEYLPSLAKQMHHVAVVASLVSTQGAHEQGNYMMHTSYALRGTIRHPSLGAWLDVLQGGGNGTLPNHVFIGNDSRHPGAGFFPAVYTPLFINNPESGIANINHFKGLTETRFQHQRMALSARLRRRLPRRPPAAQREGLCRHSYDSAIKMMKSEDLVAF